MKKLSIVIDSVTREGKEIIHLVEVSSPCSGGGLYVPMMTRQRDGIHCNSQSCVIMGSLNIAGSRLSGRIKYLCPRMDYGYGIRQCKISLRFAPPGFKEE